MNNYPIQDTIFRFSFFSPNIIVACLFSILFLISCKTTRKTTQAPLDEKSVPQLLQLVSGNSVIVEWLSAKGTATIDIDNNSNSVNTTIRMRRDSVIWVSVSAIGLEVARLLMSQDSIKLIDRVNSKYITTDFNYLNNRFNLNINFDLVQSVLLGNYFSFQDEKKIRSTYIDSGRYVLSTLGKRKLIKSINEDKESAKRFTKDVWVEPVKFRPVKLEIEDNRNNVKMITRYEDHLELENGQSFPNKTVVDVRSAKPPSFNS